MTDVKKMWIGGKWVPSRGKATRNVVNPATGRVIAKVPEATADDVGDAVKAARKAFDSGPWGKTKHRERGTILVKVAEGIRARAAELARTDTRNMGKPIVEAEIDVADAAHCFEYYAGMASKVHGWTLPVPDEALSLTLREPVGVVGQIVPWNYPLLMSAWKLAPALAAGCTSVFKPAEQSPLSALLLAEILEEAGVPHGVVNIVTGDAVAGAAIVAHPRVDKVAFTGSTDAGKTIVKSGADTVKRTTMELGGKNPNVVFADADFEAAVDGALFGAFANQGEVCSAGSRLLVQKPIYNKMCAALAEKVKRVKVGDPLSRKTKMGPLVTAEHREKVMGYIEIGKKEATLLCGGNAVKGNGWFVEPTIFRDVDNSMRIAREEIFGPVLAVIPFDTEEDAVGIANDTPYGLAGAVWTRNAVKGLRVLKQIRAGILWLNTYTPLTTRRPGAAISSPDSAASSGCGASRTTSRPSRSTSISTRLPSGGTEQ
jgi:betaine-aldehyde dehydrogenase